MIFRFFEKSKKKKFFSFTNTATIDRSKSFGKQSVTPWFAGMRFFRFRSKFESAVSPLRIRNLTLATMLRVGVQLALPQRGAEGDGLSNSSICTPSFSILITLHTHTHTLSLSLSLSLTLPAASCCDFAVDATVSPCVLCSRQNCYSHLNKINPIFFSHPEKLIAPLPPSPNPSHGVSRSQVQKASLALP